MMKPKTLFFLFFFIIVLSGNVVSIGIVGDARLDINFKSNEIITKNICFKNSLSYDISAEITKSGALSNYIYLEKQSVVLPKLGVACISYTLKLPEKQEDMPSYGKNSGQIKATVVASKSGDMTFKTSFSYLLSVFVQYPEKYLEVKFNAENVNENENVQFVVSLNNKGQEMINDAYAEIYVHGADDFTNYITTITTKHIALNSTESKSIFANLDTKGLKPGLYKAKAIVHYDGLKKTASSIFKIGTLLVDVVNYTNKAYAGKINRFDLVVKNRWNNKINNIYADLELNALKFKSATTSLAAWQTKTMTLYLDATSLKEGNYNAKVILHYENKTTEKNITISLIGESNIKETGNAAGSSKTKPFPWEIVALIVMIAVVLAIILKRKNIPKAPESSEDEEE